MSFYLNVLTYLEILFSYINIHQNGYTHAHKDCVTIARDEDDIKSKDDKKN